MDLPLKHLQLALPGSTLDQIEGLGKTKNPTKPSVKACKPNRK